jgi:tRNA-specific 2-thiouridylase
MKKILVAMSGGVDSSVATALLKRAGFQVSGTYMKLNDFSVAAEKRARKVAKIIGIPFYVFNFEKEFKKIVVDYFLEEYKAGRTPNPCVICNKEIKFGLLIKKAMSMGFEFLATGHYARIHELKTKTSKLITYKLLQGKDEEKDQSYFLCRLSQDKLRRLMFPVGNYTRKEVEQLAKDFKLPFDNIKKSMEVCFVPGDINNFLKKHLKQKPGDIVSMKGNTLGRHEGLIFYTIGQRKGIKLSGWPYFVLAKDLKKNRLIVTINEKDLAKKEIMVKDVSWISVKASKFPLKVKVKIRYRASLIGAVISRGLKSKVYSLKFEVAQRAITPGQSAVFYKGRELLGGGIIC